MSDNALNTIASMDDEKQVLEEISGLVLKERESLRRGSHVFSPRSSGRLFPLLLNGGALVALIALAIVLWTLFAAARESYILKSADVADSGADIISALLAEAQSSLEQKDREIGVIQKELADIENQLAALGLERTDERAPLISRRSLLQKDLAVKIRERDELAAQVKFQSNSLAQARSTSLGATENPLESLAEQEKLRQIFQENLRQGAGRIRSLVEQKKWDAALELIKDLQGLTLTRTRGAGNESERISAENHQALLAGLETMVLAARDGWPEDVPVPATGDGKQYAELIDRQNREISDLKDQASRLEKISRESSVQLETVLKSFNATFGGKQTLAGNLVAAGVGGVTVDNLPERIKQLQVVVGKVQDYQETVTKQSAQIDSLTRRLADSGAGSNDRMEEAVASFSQSMMVLNPDLAKGVTPDNLPQRLSQTLNRYTEASADYRQKLPAISKTAMSDNREVLRGNLKVLLGVLRDNPATAELLPDIGVHINTLLENLIQIEVARVKAQAQDELIAVMLSASGKLADEQVRMLASANNSRTDSAVVLNSLIKEIDKVAETTLKERTGKSLPRALGTVISVAKPNVTVRKAALFETFKVKRVYLSRILPNGDRIPIADADITASTGDDVILKITSTIAPTIYPEKNDLVFVEF